MIVEKALRYCSSFLSFFGGLLILRNESLQAHPFKAFAFMMIVDSGNFLQFDLAQDIWRSNELINVPNVPMFGFSLFQTPRQVIDETYYILSWLYCTNTLTQKLFQYTFYCINFGLAWDLLNSIRNPFESTDTRYKTILLVSPLLFFTLFIYWGFYKLLNI